MLILNQRYLALLFKLYEIFLSCKQNYETALTYIVLFDNPDRIKGLIDRGIDINKISVSIPFDIR